MDTTLAQEQLLERVSAILTEYGRLFRKKTNVLAKLAEGGERVETVTSDGKETTNTAEAGEFLVRNQTKARETYIMQPEQFHKKYEYLGEGEEGYDEYRALGEIKALELTPGTLQALELEAPFYFMADWGEKMVAKEGDYLAVPTDSQEVYRIARQEFGETYEPKPE